MPNALHADLVLKGATILTMDAKDSVAQTVAVKHGRIVGVGTDADVEGLIGRGTDVLDCRGKTIVPGFIDSHTHNTLVGEFRYSFRPAQHGRGVESHARRPPCEDQR